MVSPERPVSPRAGAGAGSSRPGLSRPVHFVAPDPATWPELKSGDGAEIAPERLAEICINSADCWVLRSYYELRRAGYEVTLSDRPRADAVNIGDIYALGRTVRGWTAFFVIPRGDGHEPELANFTLLQNAGSTSTRPFATVPLWSQPGLIARDPDRGERIETVSFKGAAVNLDPAFQSDAFRAALAGEGVRLEIGVPSEGAGGRAWADYRETDLILAVRNLTEYDAARKPANKLVNAWWAEVPALLGPEPAFAEVGTSPEDYIEVRRPEDVIAAIRAFRQAPGSYAAMVERGREKRTAFSNARLVARWVEVLNGPIAAAFDRWQARSRLRRMLSVMKMFLMEPLSKRRHQGNFSQGRRILDV
ncbi:glycosyltransferase [Antarcticimicrobium luteum]|uniref:Glycosyltransferase family 1 protein n=1 Tax=Antarcticimicrobium luteum TaxID=2547397 RepID=A0A4R5UT35_9RHOB|nr:glycosyltransferase family 1 protein [Antarcticimicrobium luteum]TDK42282.1 glycosyltransferase family 1 protein [Antarcticimicrobium luteum]